MAFSLCSPLGEVAAQPTERGIGKEYPLRAKPACQSPASKTPQCGVLRVEPDLREGGGHVVTDEISRDEDASKVVRPGFRMGLKPTALLRHAAKVRLAWRLAQNDTGRDVAKCFPSFTPLSHGKPCQLTHKESLRSRSPCYTRWQRGKRCKDRAEEVTAR